jgi:hypothetical protein
MLPEIPPPNSNRIPDGTIDCAQAHSLTGWNFSPKSLIQLPMTYLLKMSKCQPTNRAHYHIDASEELSHENPPNERRLLIYGTSQSSQSTEKNVTQTDFPRNPQFLGFCSA